MQQQWLEFKQNLKADTKAVNVKQEAALVNAADCISDEPSYKHYHIEGEKAAHFLQGQLTNDMETLSNTHALYAAHCNIKGRIIGLYHVWQQANGLYLQIEEPIADKAIANLEKYAKFSRVSINEVPELMTLTLWGPNAKALLEKQLALVLSDDKNFIANDKACLMRLPRNKQAYHLITSLDTCQSFWPMLVECFTPISNNGSKLFYINSSLACLTEQTVEAYTPHELALPQLGAVDFNKGCYTGQEIIARMEFRGKVKSHLCHGIIESEMGILEGSNLTAQDRVCGSIINTAKIDNNTYQSLALIQDKALESEIKSEELTFSLMNTMVLD